MSFISAWSYFYYRSSLIELRMMRRNDYSFGLSYHSMMYLNIIAVTPDCTVSGLAKMLGTSTPGVTAKVNDLVRKGLVEKVQDSADRRTFWLRLRPEIMAVYEDWGRASGDQEAWLLEKYSKDDIALFCRMLKDIADYDVEAALK
jgi:DNA-binding MarR family transcriptional regulator